MDNPFKKDGYMLPVASINSVYIDHQKVSDLFRLSLIVDECKKHQDMLGLSNAKSPKDFLDGLHNAFLSDDELRRECAFAIGHKFGKRLALLIKTLKKPSVESMNNRKNWDARHWAYWKKIKKLIFVGGVASPSLTRIFLEDIKTMLSEEEIALEVSFIEGSVNLGTEALSNKVTSADALLFDFGQTNIKRRHHVKEGSDIVIDTILPCIPAKFLYYKSQTDAELYEVASQLDRYIQKVILKTVKESFFEGKQIYLAMANYIDHGRIYPSRGGYAKLGLLFDNYEQHLQEELTDALGRNIEVRLYHDTTAVSYYFENEKDTAVLSMGTAFGIAFLDGEE